jgi:hypothetical protein
LAPGKAPALNAAITVARGDILALTDDDVLVADDWIPAIRRVFKDPAIALVAGRVDPRWQRQAPSWLQVARHGQYGPMSSPLALLHYGETQQLGSRTAVGANMVIRRAAFEALGGFAAHLGKRRGTLLSGEDHDLCRRAVAAGYRCEYRPEVRVQHWVPAERVRLRYFVRWFFWSGITHAAIESPAASNGVRPRRPLTLRYLLRRVVVGFSSALVQMVAGRTASAAAQLMDSAFALGYLASRFGSRWSVAKQRAEDDTESHQDAADRSCARGRERERLRMTALWSAEREPEIPRAPR